MPSRQFSVAIGRENEPKWIVVPDQGSPEIENRLAEWLSIEKIYNQLTPEPMGYALEDRGLCAHHGRHPGRGEGVEEARQSPEVGARALAGGQENHGMWRLQPSSLLF